MSTRSNFGLILAALGLALAAAALRPGAAAGDTLAQNRDRLFRDWAARSIPDYHTQTWSESGGACKEQTITNPGVTLSPRTDVCQAWRDLSPEEKLVFLTITHRLTLGVLNQPENWSVAQLGYRPCLKEGRNDPSLSGAPPCNLLDHMDSLYAIVGRTPGSTGCGGAGNRLYLSMDHDLWRAWNAYHGTSGPSALGVVRSFFRWITGGASSRPDFGNPVFIYGDQYSGTQDACGPHYPFDASTETRAGSPRLQTQFWTMIPQYYECAPGEPPNICRDGVVCDGSDPYCIPEEPWCGCYRMGSSGGSRSISKLGINSITDEFLVEIDQDYNWKHDSGPYCGDFLIQYILNFARTNPIELEWTPSGCGATTPGPEGDGINVVYVHGRHQQVWPRGALPGQTSDTVTVTPGFDGNSRLTDGSARSAVSAAIASACTLPEQCVVVCYSAGCARALLAFDDLNAAGTPPDGLLWTEAGASSAGGTELVSGLSGFLSWLLGKKQPIDNDISVSAMRGTYGYIQNAAPAPMYHDAGDENICVRFLFAKVCGNSKFPGDKGDGAVPVHSACGYASAGAYYDCCSGAKYANRVTDGCALHSADHYEMQAVAANIAAERLATMGDVGPERFPDTPTMPECTPITEEQCECNPLNWIDPCAFYGGSCPAESIMPSGTCSAAACGDGSCDAGEDGAGCPLDCCDASTPCSQSRTNSGQQFCRADATFTYRWMTNYDIGLMCDDVDEACAATISCAGQTLVCKGGNVWSPRGCGDSDGICTEGETPETHPADCQSCGGAGGNTCETFLNLCAGWPLLDNAECPICCSRDLPSCGAAGGNTCESTPSLCLGRQWLASYDCPVCCHVPSCGDATCEGPEENCATCPGDCPCSAGSTCTWYGACAGGATGDCPNGLCEAGETCDNCPGDCGCPFGECLYGSCTCGDGVCDFNESCATCPADCGCDYGTTCDLTAGVCVASTCPPDCGPPSCGAAGGNTCGSWFSDVCDGRPLLSSYDCGVCCFIPPADCGDGSCNGGENPWSCPADCGCGAVLGCVEQAPGGCWCDPACVSIGDCCPDACATCGYCPPGCPDGVCDGGESCSSCPADCGTCGPSCGAAGGNTCGSFGSSVCDGYPLLSSSDCGVCCFVPEPVCGDGPCNGGETCDTCPDDCGPCLPSCGAAGGNTCGGFGSSVCDGYTLLASYDCPVCCFIPPPVGCGDGSCNGGETCLSCSIDCGFCPPGCPDGSCNGGEDCSTCPDDCGFCFPSCGAAGGNTCGGPSGSSPCDGYPLLDSYDCTTCCYIPPAACGDGVCDAGEDGVNCPADCGCAAAGACGTQAPGGCWCDPACVGAGDCCPDACAECGMCPLPSCGAAGGNTCGGPSGSSPCDGYPLLPSYDCTTCCYIPPPACGDGTCDAGEDASGCPSDCGCAAPGACGTQAPGGCWCDPACVGAGDCCADACSECGMCPLPSCGAAGGNTCGGPSGSSPCDGYPLLDSSDCTTCCYIPPPECGDGACNGSEDARDCPQDCGCSSGGVCGTQAPAGCWCDTACLGAGDCCPDACTECGLPGCPSCGDAGGNTCGGPSSGVCDGFPLLTAYDCVECCSI